LEGDYQLVINGQPKQYKPGETFEIASGVPHAEIIGEKPMKALVTFTVEKGKPLTSSAEWVVLRTARYGRGQRANVRCAA
jgi:quercetin dioxygenase-like cupin family protein